MAAESRKRIQNPTNCSRIDSQYDFCVRIFDKLLFSIVTHSRQSCMNFLALSSYDNMYVSDISDYAPVSQLLGGGNFDKRAGFPLQGSFIARQTVDFKPGIRLPQLNRGSFVL